MGCQKPSALQLVLLFFAPLFLKNECTKYSERADKVEIWVLIGAIPAQKNGAE